MLPQQGINGVRDAVMSISTDAQAEGPVHFVAALRESAGRWNIGVTTVCIRNEHREPITHLLRLYTECDCRLAKNFSWFTEKQNGSHSRKANIQRDIFANMFRED